MIPLYHKLHVATGCIDVDGIASTTIFLLLLDFSDIDECSASTDVCGGSAICENTLGSYLCQCKPGFTGNGCTGNNKRFPYCSVLQGSLKALFV